MPKPPMKPGATKPKGLQMMDDLASAMEQASKHAPIKDPDGDNDADPSQQAQTCPNCGHPVPPPMHAANPHALPPRR